MKIVAELAHLEQFGIEILTGEACGLGYRILFDLTQEGLNVVRECFGMPAAQLAPAWNPGSTEKPHVASIMLTCEMLLPLGVFGCILAGCPEVFICRHAGQRGRFVYAPESDEDRENMRQMVEVCKSWEIERRIARRGTAAEGLRNTHVMTGRVL